MQHNNRIGFALGAGCLIGIVFGMFISLIFPPKPKDWTMINYFTQRPDCVYIMGQRDPTNNQTKGDVIVCGKDAVNLGKQP